MKLNQKHMLTGYETAEQPKIRLSLPDHEQSLTIHSFE